MSLNRYRTSAMLLAGLTIIGLLSISPDALPPAAVAGLLLLSFALLAGGLRRRDSDQVSA